jgi:hypothetical protein
MLDTLQLETCSTTQGCLSDKAYAIVDTYYKKIHRISFSASLLEHILDSTQPNLEVREISFSLGKVLKPNEVSSTGIYALVKAKNDWTLRISLHKNVANYLCDFDTRRLRECIITKVF